MKFRYLDDPTDIIGKGKILSRCVFTHEEHQLRNLEIEIPYGVTTINSRAFWGNKNIGSIHLPDTVRLIGAQAFENCDNLKSINIPKGVKVIPEQAFAACLSLEYIVLPNELMAIEERAFSYCKSLKYLDIPKSVCNISFDAFPDTQIALHYNDVDCNLHIEDAYSMHNGSVDIQLLKWFFEIPCKATFEELTKPRYKVPIALAYLKRESFYGKYLKKAIVSSLRYVMNYDDVNGLIKLVDNKLIEEKFINSALNCAIRNGKSEMSVILMQYKNQLGGYKQSDNERFEL